MKEGKVYKNGWGDLDGLYFTNKPNPISAISGKNAED